MARTYSGSLYAQIRSLVNDTRAEMLSYIPTEIGNHLIVARKEILAAVRVAIDEEIAWTDRRWETAKQKKAERRARENEPKPAAAPENMSAKP